MLAGIVLAFVRYAPLGYSATWSSDGGPGEAIIIFLGLSIPSTPVINDALQQYLPVVGEWGIGIFIIGALWAVQRAGAQGMLGKYGRFVLIASAALFLASGLLYAFGGRNDFGAANPYSDLAHVAGMVLGVTAVLMVIPTLWSVRPSKKKVGWGLAALGLAILIFFTLFAFLPLDWMWNGDLAYGMLFVVYISSVPLMFLGILWIERGVEEGTDIAPGMVLRAARLLSFGTLLIGAAFLAMLFVPGGPSVMNEPPLSLFMPYLYYVGIFLVWGALSVSGVRLLRLRAERLQPSVPG